MVNDSIIEDDLMTEILTWLHHNSIPYEEVAERWQKSAEFRLQFKSDETITVIKVTTFIAMSIDEN